MMRARFCHRFIERTRRLTAVCPNRNGLDRKTRCFGWMAAIATSALLWAASAPADTLRVVSYNIDDADQLSDDNITASFAGLPSVLQAIGQHHIGTNAQAIDVLGVEELNPTTLSNLVNAMNQGADTYAYDPLVGPTTGAGTDGLIYNKHTIQVVSATIIGTASTSGAPRAPMRYLLRPIGFGPAAEFYMYVSHYKASSGSEARRNFEAAEIRQDADALGPTAHIIYSGDFNLVGGRSEPAWSTLTAPGNGQAIDPTGAANWTNSSNTWKYLYSESTTSLSRRYDFELVSSAMLNQPGVRLASDTSDPFTGNFPSSKYPYAYEVFGNNGTTTLSSVINSASNTSLNDLTSPSTILNDMMEPYAGNGQQFVGSDHLPVVADYNVTLLAGDFNNDGSVGAADYAEWRKRFGSLYTQADYDIWRAHFGQPAGSGSGVDAMADVPEPTTLMLFGIGVLIVVFRRTAVGRLGKRFAGDYRFRFSAPTSLLWLAVASAPASDDGGSGVVIAL
jgi:endonuclease/exonuclease/phosphatase family metal-dependent hydrolase